MRTLRGAGYTKPPWILFFALLAAPGCGGRVENSSGAGTGPKPLPEPIAVSPPQVEPLKDLKKQVGQQVTFSGQFKGPGKVADYVVTDAGTVYLFAPKWPDIEIEVEGPPLQYGERVTVSGTLKYSPAVGFDQPPTAGPHPSPIPPYYYIEAPKVQRLKQ
jgi:hypothetical protein